MLTIVGLGESDGDITTNGLKAVKDAKVLFVKTLKTDAGKQIKKFNPISMDGKYKSATDFDELNLAIVKTVLSHVEKGEKVVYCVDGDGYSDSSVIELFKRTKLEIVAGVPLGKAKKPNSSFAMFSCASLLGGEEVGIDSAVSLLICEIDNQLAASELKLFLDNFYSPYQEIVFYSQKKEVVIELSDLDRQQKYDHSTSIFIAGDGGFNKEMYGFFDLLRILTKLTATNGCEWDKAQTHNSIAINMIEEAYEAVDAILKDDCFDMVEELGDVLLQPIFHADIAKRSGEFSLGQVLHQLCQKLVSRHTHIFGKDNAQNKEEAFGFWEKAKEKEKNTVTLQEKLDALPDNFPAVLRIQKAFKRAKKMGITVDIDKIKQSIFGFLEQNEFSKVIFSLVVIATEKDIELETALIKHCIDMIEVLKISDSKILELDKVYDKSK